MTASEFDDIAKELRPCLIKVGRDFFNDVDKAEDVAQEVLMRLWVARERIAFADNLRPLAIRMAKNVCISMWRHERYIVTGEYDRERGPTIVVDTEIEDRDNVQLLQHAMEQLTAGEQRLMAMRTEEGMEISHIAAVAGITPRSVSVILSRARKKIIELLKKGGNL